MGPLTDLIAVHIPTELIDLFRDGIFQSSVRGHFSGRQLLRSSHRFRQQEQADHREAGE